MLECDALQLNLVNNPSRNIHGTSLIAASSRRRCGCGCWQSHTNTQGLTCDILEAGDQSWRTAVSDNLNTCFHILTYIHCFFGQLLAALFKEEGTSTTHKLELLSQWHAVRHHINSWHEIQANYMPGVAQILESQATLSPTSTPTDPEKDTLYLPSSITSNLWLSSCIPGLSDIECHIHVGQADDALNKVQQQLWITSSIIQFKCSQYQASQQLSWKSRALMAKFKNKMHWATDQYIAAHTALTALDPKGSWALLTAAQPSKGPSLTKARGWWWIGWRARGVGQGCKVLRSSHGYGRCNMLAVDQPKSPAQMKSMKVSLILCAFCSTLIFACC